MSWHEIEEAKKFSAHCREKDCTWKTEELSRYAAVLEYAYEHLEEHYGHEIEIKEHTLVGRHL